MIIDNIAKKKNIQTEILNGEQYSKYLILDLKGYLRVNTACNENDEYQSRIANIYKVT